MYVQEMQRIIQQTAAEAAAAAALVEKSKVGERLGWSGKPG
jgi:hypothetical protein